MMTFGTWTSGSTRLGRRQEIRTFGIKSSDRSARLPRRARWPGTVSLAVELRDFISVYRDIHKTQKSSLRPLAPLRTLCL